VDGSVVVLQSAAESNDITYEDDRKHSTTSHQEGSEIRSITTTPPFPQNSGASVADVDPSMSTVESEVPTVWKDRAVLFRMTRPSSIPGTILFHMLGVALVVRGASFPTNYWSILLREPTLWLTLLTTNLVSATSMVVNDYYDAKLGRDALKRSKALVDGKVSMVTAKLFLMYLYAAALIVSTFLPGVPTRLSVVLALIMTYLYTKHLKPMTWVKNAVCASLIALAPWSSGSCAWNILHSSDAAVAGSSAVINLQSSILLVPEIWRVFAVLFFGVLGRELLMDCNDAVADEGAGIRTVPVVYGRRFAVKVAAASTVSMTLIATVPLVQQLLQLPASVPLWSSAPFRRLLLAGGSCAAYLGNIWKVWKSKGEDKHLIKKTVDFGLLLVFGLLMSFV